MSKVNLRTKYMITGFIFLLPAALIYFLFTVYPFFDSLLLSVQRWNGFSPRQFIGLQNFQKLLTDDVFKIALKNSAYFGFATAFFSVIIGVVLAWMLLHVKKKEGSIYRTILFSPAMLPPVVTALVFTFVYSPELGILDSLFTALGLGGLKTAWLTNQKTVLNCILFVSVWKHFGLAMVLCFASLQTIPDSLIEAARLDGASDIGIFRRVIIPLIRPVIEIGGIFTLLAGLRIYDTVVTMTNGGPGRFSTVMPMLMVENAFTYNEFGYASSMSVVFMLVILTGIILVRKILGGESYEQ